MKTTRYDSEKKLGEDVIFYTCPHCGKEHSNPSLEEYKKHIKEHKANDTLNWEYEQFCIDNKPKTK
jgi:hypothetical protein